jgi:hypothetical protein
VWVAELLGRQALLWHDTPARSLPLLDQAEPLVRRSGDARVLVDFLAVAAEVRWSAGDAAGARRSLHEAEGLGVEQAATDRRLERIRAEVGRQ